MRNNVANDMQSFFAYKLKALCNSGIRCAQGPCLFFFFFLVTTH